jgi:alpha-ribazole phosphatase
MKLILTRHGKTEENIAGIIMGQKPGKLSREGVQKAEGLRDKLGSEHIDALYCSDLKRCVDTAKILNSALNLNLQLDERLREIHFGDYQDKPYSVVKGDYASQPNLAFPNGESNKQLIKRVIDAINDILAQHPDGAVLVVTHSGPISVITAAIEKISFSDALEQKAAHNDIYMIELHEPLEYPH